MSGAKSRGQARPAAVLVKSSDAGMVAAIGLAPGKREAAPNDESRFVNREAVWAVAQYFFQVNESSCQLPRV